jgi:uncharacterized membrane protein (UPF0182 family)
MYEKLGSVSANKKSNRGKTVLKTIGSVFFAIIATSHHWLHMLLISVGLTSIGAVLFNMPPLLRIILLVISLAISIRFIFVAKRKWRHERPVAWVYVISSILSIVIVFSAVPQTINTIIQSPSNTQNPDSINTHDHNHSDINK